MTKLWALVLFACGDAAVTLPVEEPLASVVVVTTSPAPAMTERLLTGVLSAKRDATLSVRVSGAVTARVAEPGKTVATGDAILELDRREAAANLAAAGAQLDDAAAVLLDAERRLARSEVLGAGLSPQDMDAARMAVERARAAREGAAARRDLAAVQLGHHTLRAPFDGEVASLQPEVGEMVGPSSRVARVVDTSSLVVTIGLLDDEVQRAQSFTVRDGVMKVPATLRHVAPAADPRTLTWPVELAVPNAGGLRPGGTVQVTASLAGMGGVQLPIAAVSPEGRVWTVREGIVESAQVSILHERGGEAVVDGLEPGVDVVLRGPQLRDGQAVTVVR